MVSGSLPWSPARALYRRRIDQYVYGLLPGYPKEVSLPVAINIRNHPGELAAEDDRDTWGSRVPRIELPAPAAIDLGFG